MAGIGQSHLGFIGPISVEIGVEIAVARIFVDDLTQVIFPQAHERGERATGRSFATIYALGRHQALQPNEKCRSDSVGVVSVSIGAEERLLTS